MSGKVRVVLIAMALILVLASAGAAWAQQYPAKRYVAGVVYGDYRRGPDGSGWVRMERAGWVYVAVGPPRSMVYRFCGAEYMHLVRYRAPLYWIPGHRLVCQ